MRSRKPSASPRPPSVSAIARYWLAEHHAIAALGDPCPEILTARVAAATSPHPRRDRRGAAALLQRAQGGRAVPHARSALPRADRPRARPRAGRRPADRAGGGARPVRVRRRFPRAGARPRRVPRRRPPARSPVRSRQGAAGRRDRAGGVAARLVGLQRRARRRPRPAVRVRALHQRARRGRGDAGLPGGVQAVGARVRAAGDRLRVRDLRGEGGRGRAARRIDRPPAAAHGARGRRAGADSRGSGGAPLHRARARLRPVPARAPGAWRARRGAREAPGARRRGSARTS